MRVFSCLEGTVSLMLTLVMMQRVGLVQEEGGVEVVVEEEGEVLGGVETLLPGCSKDGSAFIWILDSALICLELSKFRI